MLWGAKNLHLGGEKRSVAVCAKFHAEITRSNVAGMKTAPHFMGNGLRSAIKNALSLYVNHAACAGR